MSYLRIDFPSTFTQEHIEKLQIALQEMLSINNRGAIVKKVDEEKDIPWPDPLDYSNIKDSKEKLDQKFKDGIRYFQG